MVVCKCFHVAIRGGEVTIRFQYREHAEASKTETGSKEGNQYFFVCVHRTQMRKILGNVNAG